MAGELLKQGRHVGLLVAEEDRVALTALLAKGVPMIVPGPLGDLDQIARNLFASLRDLDAQGVDVILARAFPQVGIGRAIHDRLLRAAEGKITQVG
jgi:L-threonylcarbamoyladenylate synthase